MKGSVKIMLSYDYSHFEIALASDEDMNATEVNALRKTAQRLADEAVRQYKKAKEAAANRVQGKYEKESFLVSIRNIEKTPEQDRTVRDLAMLKQYQDENWQAQFEDDYEYEDDADFDAELRA